MRIIKIILGLCLHVKSHVHQAYPPFQPCWVRPWTVIHLSVSRDFLLNSFLFLLCTSCSTLTDWYSLKPQFFSSLIWKSMSNDRTNYFSKVFSLSSCYIWDKYVQIGHIYTVNLFSSITWTLWTLSSIGSWIGIMGCFKL